jgi:hypothetical protein
LVIKVLHSCWTPCGESDSPQCTTKFGSASSVFPCFIDLSVPERRPRSRIRLVP